MNQGGSFGGVGAGAQLVPELGEKVNVRFNVFLGPAFGGRPGDKAARERSLVFQNRVPQAESLLLGGNLSRDANVGHGGHVNQVAARQCNMRGNPSPFGPQRFPGDLNQDFLTFLQNVGNLHLRR